MGLTRRPGGWVTVVVLAGLAAVAPVSPQTKPLVKVGYIPSDSFAALYIMADRHLPAADIAVETVRLSGGSEILSQVATGQLNMGGTGMGAAGFNAVAASLPVEFVAPLHSGYVEDYFTVRKASWEKEIKRIGDLKGKPVALNVRGAAVEWMLDQALKRDGLGLKDVQIKIMPFPDPARARSRARSEPRDGPLGARLDAAPGLRARPSEVQGSAARESPVQLRLPGPGGRRARQEVALSP